MYDINFQINKTEKTFGPKKRKKVKITNFDYTQYRQSNFYGTESEIWAGFGLVGSTENCPT